MANNFKSMRPVTLRIGFIVLFTVILIAIVNGVWWATFVKTQNMLESQLSRRLGSLAHLARQPITDTLVAQASEGNFEALSALLRHFQVIAAADSLSEVFLLDDNYRYILTTALEAESTYFMSAIHAPFIDSLFFGTATTIITTPTYRSGSVYLMSAFAPILDSTATTTAVMGLEADVDYFTDMSALRRRLYYSSAISIAAGIMLGTLFVALQRKVSRAEQNAFLDQTHLFLGRMVSVVAHELKNPLMIIRGYAERLGRKSANQEAGSIVEEVDRLDTIVSGYLEFARAGSSLLATERPTRFDLISLVKKIQSDVESEFSSIAIAWTSELPNSGLFIEGFPRAIRQVLLNLFLNGVQACLEAKVPVALGVDIRERDGHVDVTVEDTGNGFSKSDRKQVFEPFYTTKQRGSGIGLYIARRLMNEMGGSINIVSDSATKGGLVKLNIPKAQRNRG